VPHARFDQLQRTLNRTLNRTISQARLGLHLQTRDSALIAHRDQRTRRTSALPLGNGKYLSVLMLVRIRSGLVTTDARSVGYRCSDDDHGEDWIFRYEYDRRAAARGDYPYPIAHLHVNASPVCYEGSKPFPDLHLPTRRLSLEEIVRHLIVEHGVPTIGSREEALGFLDEQQAEFERNRTD
jgi:hypothetical protein